MFGLLERYRALGAALSPLYALAKNSQDEKKLPLISEDELREAYSRLSESDTQRVEQLRSAVNDFDWDRVNENSGVILKRYLS